MKVYEVNIFTKDDVTAFDRTVIVAATEVHPMLYDFVRIPPRWCDQPHIESSLRIANNQIIDILSSITNINP